MTCRANLQYDTRTVVPCTHSSVGAIEQRDLLLTTIDLGIQVAGSSQVGVSISR